MASTRDLGRLAWRRLETGAACMASSRDWGGCTARASRCALASGAGAMSCSRRGSRVALRARQSERVALRARQRSRGDVVLEALRSEREDPQLGSLVGGGDEASDDSCFKNRRGVSPGARLIRARDENRAKTSPHCVGPPSDAADGFCGVATAHGDSELLGLHRVVSRLGWLAWRRLETEGAVARLARRAARSPVGAGAMSCSRRCVASARLARRGRRARRVGGSLRRTPAGSQTDTAERIIATRPGPA